MILASEQLGSIINFFHPEDTFVDSVAIPGKNLNIEAPFEKNLFSLGNEWFIVRKRITFIIDVLLS